MAEYLEVGTRVEYALRWHLEKDGKGRHHYRTEGHKPRQGIICRVQFRPVGYPMQESEVDEFGGARYEWVEFKRTGTVAGYLVAWQLFRRLDYVPLDAVTVLGGLHAAD